MKFSKNPILWIGFAVVLLQSTAAVITDGSLTPAVINAVLVAAGSVIGRNLVTPVAKDE